jgi:uncharacterized membrane protein YfcA
VTHVFLFDLFHFILDEAHGFCYHRQIFHSQESRQNEAESSNDTNPGYLWNDIFGAVIWFFAAGFATACGVGGGGIYVPLGIFLLKFSSKQSSGLSQASIFGASLGGLLLNIGNKYPNECICEENDSNSRLIQGNDYNPLNTEEQDSIMMEEHERSSTTFYTRPLIDYDMVLFLAPMEMAGAVLGVLIQKLLPDWLFLSLATIVLAITSYKTLGKFLSSYKADCTITRESEPTIGTPQSIDSCEDKVQNQSSLAISQENNTLLHRNRRKGHGGHAQDHNSDYFVINPNSSSDRQICQDDQRTKRQELLQHDQRQYPKEKILYLLLLWMVLSFITLLLGGKGVDSIIGITCHSPWYVVLVAIQFLFTFTFAGIFGRNLVKQHSMRVSVHYPFQPHDVLWDYSKLRYFSGMTFIAGLVAGLIGIGGGMILGPLLMIEGVHPRVSSATTATMIVLTSSTVAIMFVISGLVPWDYALFFFAVCMSGAFVGKRYIDAYIKKTGMTSLLIGMLAAIIACGMLGCFVILIMKLHNNNWCLDGFKPFCVQDVHSSQPTSSWMTYSDKVIESC